MTNTLTNVIGPGLGQDMLLRQLYLHLQDVAIFTVDLRGEVNSWSAGAAQIFGYEVAEIMGRDAACLFTTQDRTDGQPQTEMRIARQLGRASDYRWHVRKNRSLFWADGLLTPIPDQYGEPMGYLKILRDITDRKLEQDKIRRLAAVDLLTGLANRAAFDARRAELVAMAERSGQLLLLLMIDLDQFKEVNDVLGHQAGDQLLQQVAQRLRAASRESDYVARLGGDEFAMLQLYPPSPANGGVLADKLLHELARPFLINEREARISASIGIAVCPADAATPDALMKKADLALYHAKNTGRNCYRYYTDELDQIAHRKNVDHSELKRVMHAQSFWLAYQPIVDKHGNTIAMEALLRLPGDLSLQPVDYVIGLAQETGLLTFLGASVFRLACAQLRRWRDAGLDGLYICVNTCARELQDHQYADQLDATMRDYQLGPGDVEVEITERDAIELERSGNSIISQVSQRGMRVALDDFGTGYSSLSYLRALPVSTIKLDKSFLQDVPENADANAVAKLVIQLAKELRLDVIAEGVERPEQAAFLGKLGCDFFQGHLFSPALNADQATAWLFAHAGG